MTQKEYVRIIELELKRREIPDSNQLLVDVNRHFAEGARNGLLESVISRSLGDPRSLVKDFETSFLISKVKDSEFYFDWAGTFKVLFRLMPLSPLKLALLIGPIFILLFILILGWFLPLAIFGISMAFFAFALITSLINLSMWTTLAMGSISLGFLGLTFVASLLMILISQSSILALVTMLSKNRRLVSWMQND